MDVFKTLSTGFGKSLEYYGVDRHPRLLPFVTFVHLLDMISCSTRGMKLGPYYFWNQQLFGLVTFRSSLFLRGFLLSRSKKCYMKLV